MSHSEAGQPPVRAATPDDAAEMARLLTLLGHPTDTAMVRDRWDAWRRGDNGALVAGSPGEGLLGLVTLHATVVLHRPQPLGRITSLVVEPAMRGQGLGRRLVAAAEEALVAMGCGMVEVTSNLRRADAHAFYERLGYERSSYRFQRTISARP